MTTTSDADDKLRDYLIAILEADGPTAAEQRLALRGEWRRSQGRVCASEAPVSDDQAVQFQRQRADAWAHLSAAWEQFSTSPREADEEELTSLLNSPWADVRQAAEWLNVVRSHRSRILKSWPAGLDSSLQAQFLACLVRPVARGQSLRRELLRELDPSNADSRRFRGFVHRVRRLVPELERVQPGCLSGFVERELSVARRTPVVRETPQRGKALTWVAIGLVIGLMRLAATSNRSSSHRPLWQPDRQSQQQSADRIARLNEILRQRRIQRTEDAPPAVANWLFEMTPSPSQPSLDAPADALRPSAALPASAADFSAEQMKILQELDAILARQRWRRVGQLIDSEREDVDRFNSLFVSRLQYSRDERFMQALDARTREFLRLSVDVPPVVSIPGMNSKDAP